MRVRITLIVGALLAGAGFAACGSAEEPSTPAATAVTSTGAGVTATASGGPVGSLRDVDFSAPPFASDLIRQAGGGEVPRERVRYVDLTGDGVEEAVVVVDSGGTLGEIAVGVFKAAGQGIDLAYFRKLGGRVDVRGRALVVIEAAPSPGDPECCPSGLRETTVEWRGAGFEVTSERVVSNSSGAGPRY